MNMVNSSCVHQVRGGGQEQWRSPFLLLHPLRAQPGRRPSHALAHRRPRLLRPHRPRLRDWYAAIQLVIDRAVLPFLSSFLFSSFLLFYAACIIRNRKRHAPFYAHEGIPVVSPIDIYMPRLSISNVAIQLQPIDVVVSLFCHRHALVVAIVILFHSFDEKKSREKNVMCTTLYYFCRPSEFRC